jgi:hypothetical protein
MIYIILVVFLFLICILLIWFCFYVVVSCFFPNKRAPFVPSFDRDLKLMKQLNLVKWKKIIDLWCGNAKALRFFESEFWLVGDGYDINFFAIVLAKIFNRIGRYKIRVFWKNFFKADLKKYDYIYVFLFPWQLDNIADWIRENMKNDCVVISNSFEFKKRKPFELIKNKKWYGKIYLYKKNQ